MLISDQVNICREIEAGIVRPDTPAGTIELLRSFEQLSRSDRTKMGLAAKTCFVTHFSVQEAAAKMLKGIGSC